MKRCWALAGVLAVFPWVAWACAAAPSETVGAGAAVSVEHIGLVEWKIVTAGQPVLPGRVTLVVTNAGTTAHDLVVHGMAGTWATSLLSRGGHASLVVTARPGERLRLDCDVAGHESLGMRNELTVAGHP